ncbi:N-acetylmuramoyl-L-alanine amidase [Salisediminibacterium halotolerans]|uniref:N-acetylmuramoyl-L-alanine amidase n=1 Tax=Salisediminibacterium halotolerans TaxID=517425 RepID=A0A1H9TW33_9BACI|nr:N-acetylmuramoyl-L-alanine amidase [Salisediminibacterium haloalkalitolerans]SES01262.1 N-acetylmuramoyl-L-alanine amidase [Salisediminibacterium haloalkalitolerans]
MKKMKWTVAAGFSAVFVTGTAMQVSGQGEAEKGEVSAGSLFVRDSPALSGEIIGGVSNGDDVDITATDGDWYEIDYNGTTGYSHGDYIDVTQSAGDTEAGESADGSGTITAAYLNVRENAGMSHAIIGVLNEGDEVAIEGSSGSWYEIEYNGTTGYIGESYVETDGTSGEESSGATESGSEGEVTATSLNVRADSGNTASIIGGLSNGETVSIEGENGSWYEIDYAGTEAYVHGSFIDTAVSTGGEDEASAAGPLDGYKVYVDPGHGGIDPGTTEASSITESDLVLEISRSFQAELEAAGADVEMSRTDDSYVANSQRVTDASYSGADLFVSVHANSFSTSAAEGTEVYYNTNAYSSESSELADAMLTGLTQGSGFANRGTMNQSFEVIRQNDMPAVLVEAGFMTNPSDLDEMVNNTEGVAGSMADGVIDYVD